MGQQRRRDGHARPAFDRCRHRWMPAGSPPSMTVRGRCCHLRFNDTRANGPIASIQPTGGSAVLGMRMFGVGAAVFAVARLASGPGLGLAVERFALAIQRGRTVRRDARHRRVVRPRPHRCGSASSRAQFRLLAADACSLRHCRPLPIRPRDGDQGDDYQEPASVSDARRGTCP